MKYKMIVGLLFAAILAAVPLQAQSLQPIRHTILGAIAGAVIGNNTGRGNGAQGAIVGAGAGLLLDTLANNQSQARAVDVTPGYVQPYDNTYNSGPDTGPVVSSPGGDLGVSREYRGDLRDNCRTTTVVRVDPRRLAVESARREYENARRELIEAQERMDRAAYRLREIEDLSLRRR